VHLLGLIKAAITNSTIKINVAIITLVCVGMLSLMFQLLNFKGFIYNVSILVLRVCIGYFLTLKLKQNNTKSPFKQSLVPCESLF